MHRDHFEHLKEWRYNPQRKPLLIRGARQVGKSWLVDQFGRQFDTYIKINFDQEKQARKIFEGDLHIDRLLEDLHLYSGKKIELGATLVFLDEIQECEDAIRALRYFKEELPKLHVIAAGSLLDFKIEKIGIPVGRVQYMFLSPLSFGEFLLANGRDDLREYLKQEKVTPTANDILMKLLKTYLWVGGMPAAVNAWLDQKDVTACHDAQDDIIQSYYNDIEKYARKNQVSHVDRVLKSIPTQLGKKFKFSHIDKDIRSTVLKNGLHLLEKANIAHICYHSTSQQIPLGASIDEQKYKVFFFDVGLAQRTLGLNMKEWLLMPLRVENMGGIAEQFVAQEFIAYLSNKVRHPIYYWHKEGGSYNAEVDFVIEYDGRIIPIEVKSSVKGRLRSLHEFLNTHPHSPWGLKISESGFATHGNLREIPLYGIEAFLKETISPL